MIHLRKVKKYCKDYTLIKNYEEAVNDQSQVWICHHILGEILSKEQLIDHDFYYDVPPCMLKFVTKSEHRRLHNHCSEETRMKISATMKGRPTWNKGKTLTEEHRKKLSESHKGNVNKKGKTTSIFGAAFKEHYGITRSEDKKLYMKEYYFYKCNNKFSWEA